MYKGFKCLDPKEGRVYISRDVVFDEEVFPFAALHPNAGARLRVELDLLPDVLKNPSSVFENAKISDQHLLSPTSSTNRPSSLASCGDTGTETGETPGEQGVGGGCYRLCHPVGSSSMTEADSPSQAATDSLGGSSPGLESETLLSPPRAGLSTAVSSATLIEPASSSPQPDRGARALDPTEVTAAGSPVAESSASSGVTAAADGVAAAVVPLRPVTRLQRGIVKPKEYTDGTVRWCMHTLVQPEEPNSVEEALLNPSWASAMESEHQALLRNTTWHLVPRPNGRNVIGCK